MAPRSSLRSHYAQDGLVERLRSALVDAGVDLDRLDVHALAGVDEFHLGGGAATDALLDTLDLDAGAEVLDVGCGIGGAARRMAVRVGGSVTGIDLTPEYVAAARHLSALVGLDGRTTFEVGSALDLPVEGGRFDAVTLLHVGMNVADKRALLAELARVVRPGGVVAVYDIMRTGDGSLDFPMPWAPDGDHSFVSPPAEYRSAIEAAGLAPVGTTDRTALVLDTIDRVRQAPPPVNLAHLMGPGWPTMFGNLTSALGSGTLAPMEMVARRPSHH